MLGLGTSWFLSRSAPIVLLNLLMEIGPEAAKNSTGHCNAFGRAAGDRRRVITYSSLMFKE